MSTVPIIPNNAAGGAGSAAPVVLDYEVWGFAEDVEAGTRYVTHVPVAMQLEGVRLSSPTTPGGTLVAQVLVNGVALGAALSTSAETEGFAAGDVLAAGDKIELQVLSAPGGYSTWQGLKLSLTGRALQS
jgi:hypothetical protein